MCIDVSFHARVALPGRNCIKLWCPSRTVGITDSTASDVVIYGKANFDVPGFWTILRIHCARTFVHVFDQDDLLDVLVDDQLIPNEIVVNLY